MLTTIRCFVFLATISAHPAVVSSLPRRSGGKVHDAFALPATYVLLPEQSDDINAVIKKATARLNFVTRPIARSRLRATNAAYKYLVIDEGPDTIEIAYEGRTPARAPANGSPVPWRREDGEKFEVWMKRSDGVLQHHYQAKDGKRLNAFTWSAGGDTLTLNVTLTSPRLPEPVRYRLVYLRSPRTTRGAPFDAPLG